MMRFLRHARERASVQQGEKIHHHLPAQRARRSANQYSLTGGSDELESWVGMLRYWHSADLTQQLVM
ncbi:MAG TPA: hypothetical protein VKB35_14830 [Ktedonobacteraceae bacterium]|nr:hypothetical protein [Ktedonobacteraceae bacterium]